MHWRRENETIRRAEVGVLFVRKPCLGEWAATVAFRLSANHYILQPRQGHTQRKVTTFAVGILKKAESAKEASVALRNVECEELTSAHGILELYLAAQNIYIEVLAGQCIGNCWMRLKKSPVVGCLYTSHLDDSFHIGHGHGHHDQHPGQATHVFGVFGFAL